MRGVDRFVGVFVGVEAVTEFLAGVGGNNFIEPRWFWGLIFRGEDFHDVAVF